MAEEGSYRDDLGSTPATFIRNRQNEHKAVKEAEKATKKAAKEEQKKGKK